MLALFVVPFSVEAQQTRVYRMGVLLPGGQYSPAVDGRREGLREPGLEEGKQIVLDGRDAEGDLKAVEAAARNLEAEKVELRATQQDPRSRSRGVFAIMDSSGGRPVSRSTWWTQRAGQRGSRQ